MPTRNLYLIRNAQYLDDDTDGLTELGIKQARLTTNAMRHLKLYALDCSPYPQVVETARMIAIPHQIRVKQTALLRQYDSLRDIRLKTSEIFFNEDQLDIQQTQLEIAFQAYFYPPNELVDTHEILICHANIIRDLICRAIGVNPDTWSHMMINHCGISVVTVDHQGDVQLLEYNQIRHIPEEFRTG